MKKPHLQLFFTMLSLSAFTFGGGYVIVPLIRRRVVEKHGWISEEEMLELVAIGQSAPGAIAINTASLVGYRVAGFSGALCGLLGTVIPPLVILSLVSLGYELIRDNTYVAAAMRGMQAGIAAVIADVVVGMAAPYFKREKAFSLLIMAAAFAATWFFGVNVAIIIIASGLLGAVKTLLDSRKRGGEL